jgi:hypothetical protein
LQLVDLAKPLKVRHGLGVTMKTKTPPISPPPAPLVGEVQTHHHANRAEIRPGVRHLRLSDGKFQGVGP